ncbi:MAG TPA: DUF2330 domain-containing protein [Labilithrix sp.]
MVAGCALLAGERDANACGGCMHEAPTPAQPQVESTIVSDHRMVFSVSQAQSVLWDQVRYSGNPREFAWVLPVKPGTRIELSHNEWIAALDATTQPQIIQPQSQPTGFSGGFGGGGFGDEATGGCGCGGGDRSAFGEDSAGAADAGVATRAQPPPVQVVNQETVGPYESVTIRSDMPNAMENWLRAHGYDIPDSVLPIITAYAEAKFDFIALRLQPGQGVQAMQPVRIIAPGADPTLPLRMVAAGVGASVGMTLFVISEGRYRPQNFPEATIDDSKLVWNNATSRSNYQELSAQLMAQANGSTWLTEYANLPVTTGGIPSSNLGTLYDTYYSTCWNQTRDSFPDAGDPDADAGGDDGGGADAGDDGGSTDTDAGGGGGIVSAPPPNLCQTGYEKCCEFDDLETAVFGMHRADVWVTRLRAELPVAALAQDLRLEAHPSQTVVNNVHNAQNAPASGGARIAPRKPSPLGTGIAVVGAMLLVARMLRRRR